jgi:hypothetical protein
MYVVAAKGKKPGPPVVENRPGWHLAATVVPLGIQHAVPRIVGTQAPGIALCGADVDGWVIFPTRFDPGCTASCQRCAQLVTATLMPPG